MGLPTVCWGQWQCEYDHTLTWPWWTTDANQLRQPGKSTSPPDLENSMGPQRVGLDWANFPFTFIFCPTSFSEGSLSIPEPLHVLSHSVMSDPRGLTDCSPPGSSVHDISQAGMLDWLAISSSREPLNSHCKLTGSGKNASNSCPQAWGGTLTLQATDSGVKIPKLSDPQCQRMKCPSGLSICIVAGTEWWPGKNNFTMIFFLRFFFFDVDHFLKSLLNLLQYCFCFMFWFFWPGGTCNLSSQTKDRTHPHSLCWKWSLNHWTREGLSAWFQWWLGDTPWHRLSGVHILATKILLGKTTREKLPLTAARESPMYNPLR